MLFFNDSAPLSDRVYKSWDTVSWESLDSNHTPLYTNAHRELKQKRPTCVPALDLTTISLDKIIDRREELAQLGSSDSEELRDSVGRPRRGPNPRLIKRILDEYGVQTGARNIM